MAGIGCYFYRRLGPDGCARGLCGAAGAGAAGGAAAAAAAAAVASAGISGPPAAFAAQGGSGHTAAPAAQLAVAPPSAASGVAVGVSLVGERIKFPRPSANASALEGADRPWWVKAASGSAAAKQIYTGSAQNNVLSPNYLGDRSVIGSSVFEELAAGNDDAMMHAIKAGCGTDKSPKKADTLRALLSAALDLMVDEDTLLSVKEAKDLETIRKAEQPDRRRTVGPFASYPWLQTLAEARRSANRRDPFTLGRQLAAALRVDAPGKGTRMEVLARGARDAKFTAVHQTFSVGFQIGNMVAVIESFEQFKEHATEALREAYNEARKLAVEFPECIELREVCAGRGLQLDWIPLVWTQLAATIKERGSGEAETGSEWHAGCLARFMDGVRATTQSSAFVHAAITGRSGAFGAGSNAGAPAAKQAPPAQTGGTAGSSGKVAPRRRSRAQTTAPPRPLACLAQRLKGPEAVAAAEPNRRPGVRNSERRLHDCGRAHASFEVDRRGPHWN